MKNKQRKRAQKKNNQFTNQDITQKNTNTDKIENEKALPTTKGKLKKKIIKIIIIILLLLIIALITAGIIIYNKTVTYYQTRYFRNTTINGIDCSELDAETVATYLDNEAREYSIQIMGRDENGEKKEIGVIQSEDINLSLVDALSATNDIIVEQDERYWFEILNNKHYSYNVVQGVKFDEELLRTQVEALEACQKKNMIAPTDAYIGEYSEEKGEYELIPETMGAQFDVEAAVSCVTAAIYGNAESVDLEEQGCYALPKVTTEDKELRSNLNTVNTWLSTEITYDWNGFEVVVDKELVKKWVSVKNNKPSLDEKAVAEFVNEQADQYDTYGKTRRFTTTLGIELSLPSGAFGWKTDREAETEKLIALIKKGSVSEREPVYSRKAPRKGMNDIGSSYVEADLTHQHLYLYYKGDLVLESDFVSGEANVPNNVTPAGVFGLTYKTTNAVLRGQDYETPVSYWMPYHGNFGMHDATWRTEFGGDIYLTNGSHGCLNLPLENAAAIYNYMYTGYPVICYYY